MFPLSYSGQIERSSSPGIETLLGRIADELRRDALENVFIWSSGISFGGSATQPNSSGNNFTIISSGEIDVLEKSDGLVIAYRIQFWGIVIAYTLAALSLFVFLSVGERTPTLLFRVAVSLLLWLLMAGASYLFAARTFSLLIERALDGV